MLVAEKLLNIMDAIMDCGGEASLSDLARMTGLHESAVRRFTSTMVKSGYLYQGNRGGKYSPGLKLLQFCELANVTTNIKELALPLLRELCDKISETVILAILDQIDCINILTVGSEHILQVVPRTAAKLPLHCTATGKILLAYMPEEKIDQIESILELTAYTDNTITDWFQLKNELETIRHKGVAFDNEEHLPGIRGVGAPIRGANGNVIATIAMVAPSSRISDAKIQQIAPQVENYALKISRLLGYNVNSINR
jgi:DNA-binding IclR family transcriptional regulator